MREYPYYEFDQNHYEARYWNTNGVGIAIVASVTPGVDWVAYVGADDGYKEGACLDWAAKHGAKLSKEELTTTSRK